MKTTTQTVTEIIDGDWNSIEGQAQILEALISGWTISLAKRKLTKVKSVHIPTI